MADDVLTRLASLAPDQLREAGARINFLLGRTAAAPDGNPSPPKVGSDVGLVFELVGEVTRSHGFPFPVKTVTSFARHRLYPKFADGCGILLAYVDTRLRATGVARVKAVRFLLHLMARDRRRRAVASDRVKPFDSDSLIHDLPRVADIVERNFPGYLRSGMLSVLVNKTPGGRVNSALRVGA